MLSYALTSLRRMHALAPDLPTVLNTDFVLPWLRGGRLPTGVAGLGVGLRAARARPSMIQCVRDRGPGVDVTLSDPTVAPLHAELVHCGAHVYVVDLGLSRAGTLVNGRPTARCVLSDGDVVSFGRVRVHVRGPDLPTGGGSAPVRQRLVGVPDLTARELEVLSALCRPATAEVRSFFIAPATVQVIAGELGVTEAAVKQHLTKLYAKFCISTGAERRLRLANAAMEAGTVRQGGPVQSARETATGPSDQHRREAQERAWRPVAPAR